MISQWTERRIGERRRRRRRRRRALFAIKNTRGEPWTQTVFHLLFAIRNPDGRFRAAFHSQRAIENYRAMMVTVSCQHLVNTRRRNRHQLKNKTCSFSRLRLERSVCNAAFSCWRSAFSCAYSSSTDLTSRSVRSARPPRHNPRTLKRDAPTEAHILAPLPPAFIPSHHTQKSRSTFALNSPLRNPS